MRYDALWRRWRKENGNKESEQSEQAGGRGGSSVWSKVSSRWWKGNEHRRPSTAECAVKNDSSSLSLGLF
ncbi:MAG: hypothetical protein NNA21_12170 [Nitrospira sp.]|nr:hypothetical protein [Nitrospira sp.]MCP9462581.1 hypothetical protein [Nitrospira sp.]MCP9474084.1 hypothetical protein [Nitrospira sp.]